MNKQNKLFRAIRKPATRSRGNSIVKREMSKFYFVDIQRKFETHIIFISN